MIGGKLTPEEIDDMARYMTHTADASFIHFLRRMEMFIRDLGAEMDDSRKAELVSILRAMDGHRCDQAKTLMKMAQDCMDVTVRPIIVIGGSPIVAAASHRSDESHDPEPEN